MNPEYPIFVPTKGRHKTPYTIKALEARHIPYIAVIEKQEYSEYRQVVKQGSLLVLPHQNQGLTVTRNWIWDYAQNELKTPYFWTMDDNIRDFYRLNNNIKYRTTSGTFLKIIEDFAQRYTNLYITGMQYELFVPRKRTHPPLVLNTRIYSNMLIKTTIPYRNATFFNDDTDLCLRVLKDGHCTVLFNVFLVDKIATLTVKGGMTDYYEKTNKRLEFVQELQRAHPDIVKTVWKFGRWQHQVDYRRFKGNKLIPVEGLEVEPGVNEYGMKLVKREITKEGG